MKNAIFLLIPAFVACQSKTFSEMNSNESAGFNGSFEHWTDDLPSNWNVYTSRTVEYGDFEARADAGFTTEGSQSVLFDVKECSDEGGRFSPGLFFELPASPGDYYVSFDFKSEGAPLRVAAGGVSAKTATPRFFHFQSGEGYMEGLKVVVAPNEDRFRIEFNILGPGRLWLDNVRVEGPNGFKLQ